jgi:fluoroquinolone transport system ATP-binding protein
VLHALEEFLGSPVPDPVITVDGLTYRYAAAAAPAVRDVTFAVNRCEIFGFLGPSGAGKSTTQNILIGLLDGYSGAAAVFGRSPAEWGTEFYRRIGVAFESPNHYLRLTARENLSLFAALYGADSARIGGLLESVGLAADADRRVSDFSKGMRGRLTLARALLHQPELLFLDEPTAGLDPVTARAVRKVIRQARDDGATIFLTTHDMTTADELCDRVAFLVDGRISAIDAPRTLRLAHGHRAVRIEWRRGDQLMSREFPMTGLADNHEFVELLRRQTVETIHSSETTLEDVFVQVTGRPLA